MNSIIQYFIEANLCLLIFGLLYYLFLRKETDFKFRRFYILLSSALVGIIPLLSFSNPFSSQDILPLMTLQVVDYSVIVTAQETGFALSTSFMITVIYSIFSLFLLSFFIFQVFQIYRLKALKKDVIQNRNGYELIPTNGQWPSFTFLNLLFFDDTIPYSEEEKNKVIAHEEVHIKQWHSLDIILMELLRAVFWINPVSWWLRNEIQQVHEFLADNNVLNSTNEKDYSSLLAKMTLRQMSLSVGLHFNKSFTLKRIKMMRTPKSKLKNWKLHSLLMAGILTLFVIGCDDQIAADVSNVMETTSQKQVPSHLFSTMKELQKKYPDAHLIYIETDGTNEEAVSRLKNIDPQSIAHVDVRKGEGKIGLIINKNGVLKHAALEKDGVFTVVDDPASPKGGIEEFYKQLSINLKYPEQARKLGVQGKVYVQFVVEKDGSLRDLQVVRGIGAGCDEAAMEAVKSSGEWKSAEHEGNIVAQRIVLPILFTLEGSQAEEEKDKKTN